MAMTQQRFWSRFLVAVLSLLVTVVAQATDEPPAAADELNKVRVESAAQAGDETPAAASEETAAGACGSAGSCFTPHPTPGCSDFACCSAVCNEDPFCCEVEWDNFCVSTANQICFGCGGPSTDDCLTEQTTPGCNNTDCCELVCAQDPFCCDTAWDNFCVSTASQNCFGCGGPLSGSCFFAHDTPGCYSEYCCTAVCAQDPFCCDSEWDNICANAAELMCKCGAGLAGNCFTSNSTPACNDSLCCYSVCFIDYFCCNELWDSGCAYLANNVCSCGGDEAGSCFVERPIPWCSRDSCCDMVCSLDPFCCNEEWDNFCVGSAYISCCPADVHPSPEGNGTVDILDLLNVLSYWGPCFAFDVFDECPPDISPLGGDGHTDINDLLYILNEWGPCN